MIKTILVIDDSASIRQTVAEALKEAGYNVVEACDGSDALSKLNENTVHLMICDVNMPNMDGISFVQEAKKLSKCKFTPVIMLTTESKESEKQRAQFAGAKAWVVKPFRREQMLDAVSKLILI